MHVPVHPKDELVMECGHLESEDTSPLTLQEEARTGLQVPGKSYFSPEYEDAPPLRASCCLLDLNTTNQNPKSEFSYGELVTGNKETSSFETAASEM